MSREDGARDEFDELFFRLLGERIYERGYEDTGGENINPAEINHWLYTVPWSWAEGRAVCESPLELKMLAHLLVASDGFSWMQYDHGSPDRGTNFTTFQPQAEIGKYRVDFLITVSAYEGAQDRIIVECDGHDFHERTKQQAARDRSRDRWLTAQGFRVMRFTGSELYHDHAARIAEITELASELISAQVAARK